MKKKDGTEGGSKRRRTERGGGKRSSLYLTNWITVTNQWRSESKIDGADKTAVDGLRQLYGHTKFIVIEGDNLCGLEPRTVPSSPHISSLPRPSISSPLILQFPSFSFTSFTTACSTQKPPHMLPVKRSVRDVAMAHCGRNHFCQSAEIYPSQLAHRLVRASMDSHEAPSDDPPLRIIANKTSQSKRASP